MINNLLQCLRLFIIFLPFMIFQFLNKRANYKKEMRYKQFIMPVVSLVYFVLMFGVISKFYELTTSFGRIVNNFMNERSSFALLNTVKNLFVDMSVYIALVAMSIAVLAIFIFIKKFVLGFCKGDFGPDTIRGKIAGLIYEFDESDNRWYIKKSCGQMRTFIKYAYRIVFVVSVAALFYSYELFSRGMLNAPFCPVLAIIVMGELSYFADGLMKDECKSTLVVNNDNSKRFAMYALLRKPLGKLFGDKLASEGTTINVAVQNGGAAEDILSNIEKEGGHIGENYAAFMRKKIDGGITPNVDYLRSGYDLAVGKSLLFNTPFYGKLVPYAFYGINRCLLTGKKVLVVMGRHGTENDIVEWCREGITSVTNVPDLYKISILSGKVSDDGSLDDIGIISRSGVHDTNIHKANAEFLKKVGFVVIVEPSRLVTTAQIGLNLLVKCCGGGSKITFCSMDRNCDGLVDSLSHILMTNITEVSATEYPRGMSSFMCWKADNEYLQHRMFPGISRYLGLGTELSFVALKNQVKQAVWYGGDAYPVLDAHWIAKQYYYDFLKYANLPVTQESFDQYFKASFNMCNERVDDYSYVSVEDDRNNLFESRRNFATIAEVQGFVNVISSEYMLREYMADNTGIFTADAKAIPYITADYAGTKRNNVLALCLLLCVGNVSEKELQNKLELMGVENKNCDEALWDEMCDLFCDDKINETDKEGRPVIVVDGIDDDDKLRFEKDSVILQKREYYVESGKFENVYTIENKKFSDIILDDLRNAGYIAEHDGENCYIGTELKGHIYQKYLPGQFFTLNGKYYEMISATADNKIMIRRASEHINGRMSYRQVRKYILNKIRNSEDMGALKTVNNIGIHYLYSDFEVETKGYWKLKSYNDFEGGSLVEINGVPGRRYINKQILKLDFSSLGDLFTDSVRKTLTVLLNEVFVTLFAENQSFISAVTPGECEIPATYSLEINDNSDFTKCIFIIEDSQLDIGLLVAVERNLNRIMDIITDYLAWNDEKIESGEVRVFDQYVVAVHDDQIMPENEKSDSAEGKINSSEDKDRTNSGKDKVAAGEDAETENEISAQTNESGATKDKKDKKSLFTRIIDGLKSLFKKSPEKGEEKENEEPSGELTGPDAQQQDSGVIEPEDTEGKRKKSKKKTKKESAESDKETEVISGE